MLSLRSPLALGCAVVLGATASPALATTGKHKHKRKPPAGVICGRSHPCPPHHPLPALKLHCADVSAHTSTGAVRFSSIAGYGTNCRVVKRVLLVFAHNDLQDQGVISDGFDCSSFDEISPPTRGVHSGTCDKTSRSGFRFKYKGPGTRAPVPPA